MHAEKTISERDYFCKISPLLYLFVVIIRLDVNLLNSCRESIVDKQGTRGIAGNLDYTVTCSCNRNLFLSDEGPMLETLDYTIRIGSTPTFLYFHLYLYSAHAGHYVYFNFSNGLAGATQSKHTV